ncbi:glycoside hydrolase [Flavobacterium sp. L1I52]|uniref:Glycoside hydrolase n=1 Tax=Flavobacterium pokkalii TaxID=1940408 RepID=A0ABR7USZ6_9FLAO|nr:glycoside hydrolase family 28 protein [Flavobacterium pokkalii]MBD0726011.1 glycoside hydrolase [Flavobacterium pokkalii]
MIKISKNSIAGLAVLLVLMTVDAVFAQNKVKGNSKFPFHMPEVQLPKFKADTLNILDFGAIPNTNMLCTKAINEAIERTSKSGGGVVLIPSGLWTTGPIKMKSNVNLHTKNGAFIRFTDDMSQYKLINSYFEGSKTIRCESPIMGIDLENIAITGQGIFDGNGMAWRPIKSNKMTAGQWEELVKSGGVLSKNGKTWYPSQGALTGNEEQDKLPKIRTIDNMEPYKQALRPVMVSLVNCKKVLLDGVTFQNSPAWNVNPLMCEHLTINNVNIRNPWFSQNGDGLDIESCRIGKVTNCRFDVGDDAICIKSGKDKEGRDRAKPTELFVISDCVVYHAHGGFVVGSEMSGGVRNILAKNLTFIGTDCGLRFKSTRGRGGVVENIWVEDVRMSNIPTEAIRFNLYYFGKNAIEDPVTGELMVESMPVTEETPAFRNMYFKNVFINGAKQAVKIMGLPEMPVENIQFKNVFALSEVGMQINYAKQIVFDNVDLSLEKQDFSVKMANSQNVSFQNFNSIGQKQLFLIGGDSTKTISLNSKNKKMDFQDIKIPETIRSQVELID